jgi:hypothetical protein
MQRVELGIIERLQGLVRRPTPWHLYAGCLSLRDQPAVLLTCMHLEKPPPDEDDDDKSKTSNGTILDTVSIRPLLGPS